MTHLILTDDEREVLTDILETEISDLRMEIMGTDRLGYKEALQNRERILKKILAALQETTQAVV
jgi:hypothetical protein